MAASKQTKYGEITISEEAIAQVAGEAAISCYGVMGLAPSPTLNGVIYEGVNKLLKNTDYVQGVYCHKSKNAYQVDVYIVVAYGVKITEVVGEVQKKIAYDLKNTFPIDSWEVNIFVQDVKEIE